ncbi:MAG TPA: selenocysteine-specific translation elongation factor [Anaerovoracaceae bacterium]|nr:selenocysteine-specific translation elongation factor [Anaerovoracaceae bacterium]
MRNIIVGTAGHVDHGKTSLIKMLTGVDTDRLKEEKKRGITIELGFADMSDPSGQHIGIIDVPGHERFIKNMLAGIGGIDMVLLVVAADEGVMPQTIEHFEIMKTLKIKKGIIVLTKTDLVDDEWIHMISDDIRMKAKASFLEDAPIIEVSSFTGKNIEELKSLIFKMATDLGRRREDPPMLRIPIDRVFTIDGFGTVVTGTLMEGAVTVGDEVQIYPGERTVKVRNLQVHGNMVNTAYAGQRTAVNLLNVKKEEIDRGEVIAARNSMKPTMLLDVKIEMFNHATRVLGNESRLHLYYGSAEVLCKAILLDREKLEKGEQGYAQLRLEKAIAVKDGDRFVLRFYSPLESIGGGVILDANPTKRKRYDQDVLHGLQVKESSSSCEVLEQLMRESSKDLTTYRDLALKTGMTIQELMADMNMLIEEGRVVGVSDEFGVHIDFMRFVKEAAAAILNEYHTVNPISQGMLKAEFRKRLSNKIRVRDNKAIELFIRSLMKEDFIQERAGMIALASFRVEYQKEHLEMQTRLEKRYLDYGYQIPGLEEAIEDFKDKKLAHQIVEALSADGKLKRLNYQLFMHVGHWDSAMTLLREQMDRNGSITLAEYRDLLGTSRKYAVLILEYLDEQKITRLEGDSRVLIQKLEEQK